MNTEKEKNFIRRTKKAEKVLKDKVPVQQTGTYSEATKKEVRRSKRTQSGHERIG